jgi:hypothetical protein
MRDDNLTDRIAKIKKDLVAYKSAQPMSGDSLIYYNTSSTDSYDFSGVVSYIYPAQNYYRIVFIYDTSKNGALMTLKPFYRQDNSDVMASPSTPNHPASFESQINIYREPPTDSESAWQISLQNNTFDHDITIYVKLFFSGTDSGTWTISAL